MAAEMAVNGVGVSIRSQGTKIFNVKINNVRLN
jgi:hypothetical protein